jgi:hypothetical protein
MDDGTSSNSSKAKTFKKEWQLFWKGLIGEEFVEDATFSDQILNTQERIKDFESRLSLDVLSLEDIKAITKELSSQRKELHQKLESLNQQIEILSDQPQQIAQLSDEGLKLSEELHQLNFELKQVHEREEQLTKELSS